jgi:hypothetical protein
MFETKSHWQRKQPKYKQGMEDICRSVENLASLTSFSDFFQVRARELHAATRFSPEQVPDAGFVLIW